MAFTVNTPPGPITRWSMSEPRFPTGIACTTRQRGSFLASRASWWPTFSSPTAPSRHARSAVCRPINRATRVRTGAARCAATASSRTSAPAWLPDRSVRATGGESASASSPVSVTVSTGASAVTVGVRIAEPTAHSVDEHRLLLRGRRVRLLSDQVPPADLHATGIPDVETVLAVTAPARHFKRCLCPHGSVCRPAATDPGGGAKQRPVRLPICWRVLPWAARQKMS